MLIEKYHVLIWPFSKINLSLVKVKNSSWEKFKLPVVNVTFLMIILYFGLKDLFNIENRESCYISSIDKYNTS